MPMKKRVTAALQAVPILLILGLTGAGCGAAIASSNSSGASSATESAPSDTGGVSLGDGLTLNPAPPSTDPVEPAAINWSNPEGGQEVDSLAAAEMQAPYNVLAPDVLGTPTHIFVTTTGPSIDEPNAAPDIHVQMLFDDPQGEVDVEQGPPPLPAEEWVASGDALIGQIGQPDIHGTAGWTDIGSGVKALWTEDELRQRADIRWLVQDGKTLVYVSGPAMSLDRLTSLATKVEADFQKQGG
jgi:hypothetical protein